LELVYLWVEDYKNIHHQGFNFSPRFHCEYKEEKNELTINENDDYIPNFFGKNINVTAIVGKNGSGKSSLLELIMLSFFNGKISQENNNWLLFYNNYENKLRITRFDKKLIYFSKVLTENCHSLVAKSSKYHEINQCYFSNNTPKIYNILYNPSSELLSTQFLSFVHKNLQQYDASIYDIDFKPYEQLNVFSFPSKKNRYINIKKNDNISIINMFKSIDIVTQKTLEDLLKYTLKNNQLIFIPHRIYLEINTEELEYNIKKEYIKEILLREVCDLSIESLYRYFILIILSVGDKNYEKNLFNDYFFENNIIKEYLQEKYQKFDNEINDSLDYNYIIKKMSKYLYDNIDEFIKICRNIKLERILVRTAKQLNNDIVETAKLIDLMNEFEIKDISSSTMNQISKDQKYKVLSTLPSYIDVVIKDTNHIEFTNFSLGEKHMINFIYSTIYYLSFFKTETEYINFILDEVETALNPNWQKELMNIFIKICKYLKFKIMITISTHSPFIISDLPRENIIFLEDGKQVDGLKEKKQTFGANIHTLLSDSFFIEDGLMGEFAKGKINEIKRFYDVFTKYQDNKKIKKAYKWIYLKKRKKFEQIQSIIGEPFLKTVIKNYLDEIENILFDDARAKELAIKRLVKEFDKDDIIRVLNG